MIKKNQGWTYASFLFLQIVLLSGLADGNQASKAWFMLHLSQFLVQHSPVHIESHTDTPVSLNLGWAGAGSGAA